MVFRRRLAGWKAAAIGVFIVLTANQWISLFRLHSLHRSSSPPEFDPPRKTRHVTKHGNDQRQDSQTPEIEVVNEIIHRAFFGLGHRFHRSAAVYHLAQCLSLPRTQGSSALGTDSANIGQFQHQQRITHLRFHWESCLPSDQVHNSSIVDDGAEAKKEYNVFRYLFGDDLWELKYKNSRLPTSRHHLLGTKDSGKITRRGAKPQIRRNMIVIRNDIPGYIAGQLYKDLKLPVTSKSNGLFSRTNEGKLSLPTPMTPSNQYEVILNKVMNSDVDFYHRLVDNYQFKEELREFQTQHKWNERPLVVGLHLRAGNGEDAHFTESGRDSSLDIDESTMIARLIQLTNMAMIREKKRLRDLNLDLGQDRQEYEKNGVLRPLLFVATDTAHLLPLVDKMINQGTIKEESGRNNSTLPTAGALEVVTWPQDRLPKNSGVSFDTLQGKGESCLQGWRSAMSDALLLSTVDVLIAAKRSTFTQSLPLSLGFDRNREKDNADDMNNAFFSHGRDEKDSNRVFERAEEMAIGRDTRFSFCEVSELDFIDMTCFADARTWLFRGQDDQNHPISEDEGVSNPERNDRIWSFSIANTTSGASDHNHTYQHEEHKATVLLPDVGLPSEFDQAREFLRRENTISSNPTTSGTEIHESIFRYGRSKINKKYRDSHKVTSKTDNSSWNIIFNTNA